MDKNNILIIASALSLCSMLLFSDNLEFVYASSVSVVSLPSGTPLQSVIVQGGTTNRTYITASVAGVITSYVKNTNVFSIGSTLTLSGTTGGAIVHNTEHNEIVVFTNEGISRISTTSNSLIQFISDVNFNGVTMAVYDHVRDRIYAFKSASSLIYSLDAGNLAGSYLTWNDASMTGLNVFVNTGIQFALDADDGIIFISNACTSGGVLKIDNLSGTWNESACVDVAGVFQAYGLGIDTESDFVLVGISDNAQVKITNYGLSTLVTATVDTIPRFITVSSETQRAYVQHSTLDQVTILSTIDGSNLAELAICDNPINAMNDQTVKDTLEDGTFVFITCSTGSNTSFVTDTTGTSGGNIINGVDCDDPIKAQTLLCRMQTDNGVSLPSQLLNQSSTTIFCQTGIIQCTDNGSGGFTPVNPDSKTNGVGYIMTLIALGIMVGILWVASRGDLTSIPTFIWFIATIAVVAAMTALNYVDPTFLIITVVAIIGFAVAKAKGVFSGGQIFAGEAN